MSKPKLLGELLIYAASVALMNWISTLYWRLPWRRPVPNTCEIARYLGIGVCRVQEARVFIPFIL